MKYCIALFTTLVFGVMSLYAQPYRIYGAIYNEYSEPLPEAFIQLSDSDSIIYPNAMGQFNISPQRQLAAISISAPGYVTKDIVLPYNYKEAMYVYLSRKSVKGKENVHEIIRLAQNQRPENERKYTYYTAQYYKRCLASLHAVPYNLPIISGLLLPARKDTGKVYFSEQQGRIDYSAPYSLSDSVTHFQAAGRIPAPDFNYITDKDLSLYHEFIQFEELDFRKFFSPLGSKALQLYDFELIKTFSDGERTVYQIQFTPKRNGTACLSGTLSLYDTTFTIASADFQLDQQHHLETLESISVSQQFTNVKNRYSKLKQELKFDLNINGYKGSYISSTYFLNQKYKGEHPTAAAESIFEISSKTSSNKNWEKRRPKPIKADEVMLLHQQPREDIYKKESLQNLYRQQVFRPLQILYRPRIYHYEKYYFNLSPLYYLPGYNTVEGPYLRYELPIHTYGEDHEWLISPELRYGFSDMEFKSRMLVEYTYSLQNPRKVSIEAGHILDQFNEEDPISAVINSFYSLFLSRNYLKFYGKDYIKAGYDLEISNGLELQSSLEYASRYPVYNSTDFSIFGGGKYFGPNNPQVGDDINSKGFDQHLALTLRAQLAYQFHQRYKTINGKKINLQMQTPRLYFNFRQGLPSSISETQFSFLSGGISFQTNAGNLGYTKWDLSGGGFVDRSKLEFIDYQHFNGTQTFYLQPSAYYYNPIKQFSTLGYYEYSTDLAFIEAHLEHHFDGALLSRIPGIRKSGIHSFAGINYLNTFEKKQFAEFFLGIDNIADIFRLEVAAGLDNFQRIRPTFLVGVDFNYLYYLRNKK